MALTISATDTELPPPLNAVFNQTLLRNARVRAPYFTGVQPSSLARQKGSNVAQWRRINTLSTTTTALSELQGTAAYMQGRDASTLSVNDLTTTMSKYGSFVILNEEVQLFNFPGKFDKILEIIGINAGQSLNILQRDVAEDNATLVYAGGVASDGAVASKITAGSIQEAVNTLDKNSAMTFTPMTTGSQNIGTVPIQQAFWGLCHPDVAVDIANLSGFIGVQQYAGQTQTVLGEFGVLNVAGKGVRFISSEDAGVDASSGASGAPSANLRSGNDTNADLYTTIIMGKEAIGSVGLGDQYPDGVFRAGTELDPVDVIVKSPRDTGTSDPYNEISTVAWKAWHAGKILNSSWVRGVRSAASVLNT